MYLDVVLDDVGDELHGLLLEGLVEFVDELVTERPHVVLGRGHVVRVVLNALEPLDALLLPLLVLLSHVDDGVGGFGA